MIRIRFLLFIVSLIIIDQLSKYIVRHSGGFYICNPGIAFGWEIPEVLFWAVYTIIIGLALYLFSKKNQNKYLIHNTLYLILISSGAFSNLIDRVRYGCVIDFIDLKFWPVFNLADAFITIGGIMIVICLLRYYRRLRSA